jgi:multidrug efflux pump subunit AcrB
VIFVIVGGVSFSRLPVAQYRDRAADHQRRAVPGASADVVAATVVAPIEQQINGVEKRIWHVVELDGGQALLDR